MSYRVITRRQNGKMDSKVHSTNGRGRPDRVVTEERHARFRQLHADGKSDGEIAMALGVAGRTVYRWRHDLFKLPPNFSNGRN